MRWVLVVPFKHASRGKSRLAEVLPDGERAALARAMALDTVEAALAATSVDRVLLVSEDEVVADALRGRDRVRLVPEPAGVVGRDRLNAAVAAGLEEVRRRWPDAAVAVLLADLPMLLPAELEAALGAAQAYERSMVVDWQGAGTTLLAALPGVPVSPQFGVGSAAAHGASGHVRLEVPVGSGLRRDVDLPGDLGRLAGAGPQLRTGAVLRAIDPPI